MKKRTDIDKKYLIDTKDLFKNDSEFNKECSLLQREIPKIKKYEGNVVKTSDSLLKLLELDADISKRVERVYIYAHLHNDFDLADKNANELYGKAMRLYEEYITSSSFATPEIINAGYDLIKQYIRENKGLKKYQRLLKEVFRLRKHVLSKEEETILAQLSDSMHLPEEIHSKLLDADLKFSDITDEKGNKVQLNSSNYATYIESKNRSVRIEAFKEFYKGYKSVINTTATSLAKEVKNNNTIAKIRKYSSALDAALEANNVDIKVYKALLASIDSNLDVLHRQWDLRKKVLGLDELHIYDTYVPLTKEYDKEYSFEEGKKLVLDSLSVLGEDYISVLNKAFNENWIDVYPTENKRSGGYCTAAYLAHPYVFLNFDGRYDEVSTIAHELGHAMHYYYAIKNNTYQDYNYSIFVAEVASQVNELLMAYYVLDNSNSKEEKIFIIDELIKRFKASVVRQTMFSEFEYKIHELDSQNQILTKELLNDTYYDLNKKYYGHNIVIDDEIKYEWSRIPHFYYNFYVYQYSTGYIAALKIAKDIYNHVDGALEKYLKFLGLGATKDPVESLKIAGVDLTDTYVYESAFKEFATLMDKFEDIIKG